MLISFLMGINFSCYRIDDAYNGINSVAKIMVVPTTERILVLKYGAFRWDFFSQRISKIHWMFETKIFFNYHCHWKNSRLCNLTSNFTIYIIQSTLYNLHYTILQSFSLSIFESFTKKNQPK